ncbi:hypothetical protein FM107_14835 [Sphingobacterium sp. JB170]|nr:hypothetical protein FM107_14835 [Sphingobacterium sp. JB170]
MPFLISFNVNSKSKKQNYLIIQGDNRMLTYQTQMPAI